MSEVLMRVTAIFLLSLTACGEKPQSETQASKSGAASHADTELVQRAKAVLRSGVGLNPKDTQFRNVFTVEGNAVCGEINWQDVSGQYRGFVPFIYRYGIEVIDNDTLRAARFASVWVRLCENRSVTSGKRAALPEHQREDFAQRLKKFDAAGGKEEPAQFHRWYWENLSQIEKDLDQARATEVEAEANKKNAEAGELVNKMRKQLSK
jgi:hypothetical protein